MILPLFAIYDSKALNFLSIYQCPNADIAKRAFATAVNDPNNTDLYQYPNDFSLIEIGSYDNETGVVSSCNHVNHGMAAQFQTNKE